MKRVLTAAVFGGLMIFAVPHGASADHNAEHKGGDCSAKTEQQAPESEQKAPPRQGDREGSDGDGGEILF